MTSKEAPQFDLNAACDDFHNHIKSIGPKDDNGNAIFRLTKENQPVIKILVKYFSNQQSQNISLQKGIFLRGPYGTGKTLMMRAFATWPGNQRRFRMVNCRDIQKDAAANGFEALLKYSKQSYNYKRGTYHRDNGAIVYCFDDFGAEKTTKFYGTEINVMEELIQDRYNEFEEAGMLTHVTSNLKDGDYIEKMYGGRVRDRLRQMFNFIDLLGDTNRK
jgi:hypothetical protein